jgi:HK97 family phage portal protein
MRLFGFQITRTKAAPQGAQSVDDSRGWLRIFEWRPGAWQADAPAIDTQAVLSNWSVFACMTLIAGDIGKMAVNLMQPGPAGSVWAQASSPAFGPVLTKPNDYQTRGKFFESWMLSKLSTGNTYALKVRDKRRVVTGLHVLDPSRCRPLVAPDGSVWYELGDDLLAQVPGTGIAVPASEVIHDRMWCLFHPLVGLSPIFACGLAATQGLKIQGNSARFFENMSRPSGVLTAPAGISDETAKRLKAEWESNFTGDRIGRVAVLGDGLKYEAMSVTPIDAQMVEQLKMSAEMVCSAFHVPAYKVGVGAMPTYQNAEVLNQIYYSDCLQVHIEAIEALLDEGLGIRAAGYRTEFDLDALLRMDSATQVDMLGKAVGGGWLAPNEARATRNLPPVEGGGTPYLQQQNYSLGALARRDALDDPFGKPAPAAEPAPAAAEQEGPEADAEDQPAAKNAAAIEKLHADLLAMRESADATDSRRSSQLAELLADVHRQIELLQQAQQSTAQRTGDEVDAIRRRAALESFSRLLECPTTH